MNEVQDIASIKNYLREYEAAISAGDIAALANSFAHDAVVMPHDGSVLNGREEIKSWYKNLLEPFKAKQATSFDEIEVTGDSAFLRMSFTSSFTPKGGGKPIEVNGKAMGIYKRQTDASWKGSRVMWNADKQLPAPGK